MLSLGKVLSDSLIKWHLTFSIFNVPVRTGGHTFAYELVREEMETDAVIKSAILLSATRHTFKGKEM